MQKDPVFANRLAAHYLFADGKPLTNTDPTGKQTVQEQTPKEIQDRLRRLESDWRAAGLARYRAVPKSYEKISNLFSADVERGLTHADAVVGQRLMDAVLRLIGISVRFQFTAVPDPVGPARGTIQRLVGGAARNLQWIDGKTALPRVKRIDWFNEQVFWALNTAQAVGAQAVESSFGSFSAGAQETFFEFSYRKELPIRARVVLENENGGTAAIDTGIIWNIVLSDPAQTFYVSRLHSTELILTTPSGRPPQTPSEIHPPTYADLQKAGSPWRKTTKKHIETVMGAIEWAAGRQKIDRGLKKLLK